MTSRSSWPRVAAFKGWRPEAYAADGARDAAAETNPRATGSLRVRVNSRRGCSKKIATRRYGLGWPKSKRR